MQQGIQLQNKTWEKNTRRITFNNSILQLLLVGSGKFEGLEQEISHKRDGYLGNAADRPENHSASHGYNF